jgi:hypothetical protein
LADAVFALLKDPTTRARMAERGHATAADYDWPLIARRVLEYYGELMHKRVSKPARLSLRRRALKRLSIRKSVY